RVREVAVRVIARALCLQRDEALTAVFGSATHRRHRARQDGHERHRKVDPLYLDLHAGGRHELLQRDDVGFHREARVRTGVPLQLRALRGAGSELGLTAAHPLGQVLILLIFLSHAADFNLPCGQAPPHCKTRPDPPLHRPSFAANPRPPRGNLLPPNGPLAGRSTAAAPHDPPSRCNPPERLAGRLEYSPSPARWTIPRASRSPSPAAVGARAGGVSGAAGCAPPAG